MQTCFRCVHINATVMYNLLCSLQLLDENAQLIRVSCDRGMQGSSLVIAIHSCMHFDPVFYDVSVKLHVCSVAQSWFRLPLKLAYNKLRMSNDSPISFSGGERWVPI